MVKGEQDRSDNVKGRPGVARLIVHDRLPDSFPVLPDESKWLMTLLSDELARIIADD
jgi:hypothetical protein